MLPKPVVIVSSSEPSVIASPGSQPAETETISATPVNSAARSSASIALSLYFMFSHSISAMPRAIHRTWSRAMGSSEGSTGRRDGVTGRWGG